MRWRRADRCGETQTKGRTILRYTIVVALLIIALPAQAHTPDELEEWQDDWSQRVMDRGFNVGLAIEFTDMVERHMWYYHPQPVVTQTVQKTTPPSPARDMGSNVEQWRDLVAAYFPAGEVNRALCIMSYESGGNPNAKNPSSSARGLFQILASLWAPHFSVTYEQLYDPETNVRLARAIWNSADGSWIPWSPYKRGLCH